MKLKIDPRAARLRHARYYVQVVYQARTLYETGGENVVNGLKLFDRERQQVDSSWLWLRQQPPTDDTDQLILDFADGTLYIRSLRYSVRNEQIPQIEAQLVAARRQGNKVIEGYALGNLGNAFDDLGDIPHAIELYEQVLMLMRDLEDPRGESIALGNLGLAYRNLGDVSRAIEYHEQHLLMAREISDQRGEGDALGNLGAAYYAINECQPAITYYDQSLAIKRAIGNRKGEATSLGNLGLAYHNLGEYQRAIDYYQQQLMIVQEIGDRHGEGNALNNLGFTHDAMGEHQQAAGYYTQHLRISNELGDAKGVAVASWNLGEFCEEQGHLVQAAELMQVAADFFQQVGHIQHAEMTIEGLERVHAKLETQQSEHTSV